MSEIRHEGPGFHNVGPSRESGQKEHIMNESSLENTRMKDGQKLVMAGFIIAVVGIILYCLSAFAAGFDQDPAFITEILGVIGLGTLLWLVGAVKYLNGAIDSKTFDDDL